MIVPKTWFPGPESSSGKSRNGWSPRSFLPDLSNEVHAGSVTQRVSAHVSVLRPPHVLEEWLHAARDAPNDNPSQPRICESELAFLADSPDL